MPFVLVASILLLYFPHFSRFRARVKSKDYLGAKIVTIFPTRRRHTYELQTNEFSTNELLTTHGTFRCQKSSVAQKFNFKVQFSKVQLYLVKLAKSSLVQSSIGKYSVVQKFSCPKFSRPKFSCQEFRCLLVIFPVNFQDSDSFFQEIE